MPKGILLEKNKLIMRESKAEAIHPENGEKIDISTNIFSGMPVVMYKNRLVTWNIEDIINESIELIDNLED